MYWAVNIPMFVLSIIELVHSASTLSGTLCYTQVFLAWISQDVGHIPLRLWSMVTWLHHAIPADFSGALSCCKSPVLPLDSDPVTGKAAEEVWTLRWLLLFDMVHYHARSSHWKIVNCGHEGKHMVFTIHDWLVLIGPRFKIHQTRLCFPVFTCPVLVSLCPL